MPTGIYPKREGHSRGCKKGSKFSIAHRIKISLAHQGKNNPAWKGGIHPENRRIRHFIEYRLWREAIFSRDNWTCQDCGKRGIYLEAHHLKSFAKFPELRFALDNGISLCSECHKKTPNYKNHKEYVTYN